MAKNEVVAKERNITDVVLGRVSALSQNGEIVIPEDYSAENALKAAWLILQTVENKKGDKALKHCSQTSIANALLDMVVQGLNPAKKQCYFIMYGKELALSRSYMGTIAAAKRFGAVKDVKAHVVYEGDEFEYEIDPMGDGITITRHAQKLENINIKKIKAAYAVVTKTDGSYHVEIMTMDQIKKSWAQGATKGDSPAHTNFAEEMAKKSVINRACKLFINTSDDSAILTETFNRVTDNDYRRDDDVIIDVDDADIREVKDEAVSNIFGCQSEEKEEVKETIDEEEKTDTNESDEPERPNEEIATPFDEPYSDEEAQENTEAKK